MTRKEEMQNKLLELIEHVKDAPKKEALAAVGLDMAEWADKTLIDNACKWLKENSQKYVYWMDEEFGKEDLIEDFKKYFKNE